jgi:hypothetical protein
MKVGPSAGSSSVTRPPSSAARTPAGRRSFLEVLRAGDREVRPPARAAPKAEAPRRAAEASPLARGLARALDGAAKGETRIDALLEAAARGKTFTAAEMLAMQATVFRYSQTVELLSRATDRLVGAVKQTLGTQV